METNTEPFRLNITVKQEKGIPMIFLNRKLGDPELIKQIVTAALSDTPLVVLPSFRDKLASINSLIAKGIMYKEQTPKGEIKYYFTQDLINGTDENDRQD